MEPEFLEQISLVTSVKQVNTRTNRINTAQLYKQQKFNLLREESEGYSKLIVELYSNLPEYTDKMWTMGMDRQSLLEKRRRVVDARVEIVLDNVKSLIGYFDLDPNRVLDLIFDVFAANCVEHWDFYLALLEKSTWRPTRKMVKKKKSTSDGSDGAAAYQTTKTTTTTSTPVFEEEPKSVCAQILGFKFSYYNRKREMADAHNSDTATSSSSSYPTTPSQLFWMTAILMKHDFIRLDDLYPHLGPNDEHLDVEYEEFLRDIEEQCKSAGKFTGVAGVNIGLSGSFNICWKGLL